MDLVHERIVEDHGWRKSQCDASWLRKREGRPSEIVGEEYLPKYSREVTRLATKKQQIRERYVSGAIGISEYLDLLDQFKTLPKIYN